MTLAFIPWFELPNLPIGPVTIQSFGVLSAIGILVAVQLAARAARQDGLDPNTIFDFAVAFGSSFEDFWLPAAAGAAARARQAASVARTRSTGGRIVITSLDRAPAAGRR